MKKSLCLLVALVWAPVWLSVAVVALAVRVLEKGTAWVFRAASLLLLLAVHEFSPARVAEKLRKEGVNV